MRERSSVKPHSCHTFARLQYISSSKGHDSASPVTTAGILIIVSTTRCIFQANYKRRNENWRTMRVQIKRMETYSSVADKAFETRRHACLTTLTFPQLLVCSYKRNAETLTDTSKMFISPFSKKLLNLPGIEKKKKEYFPPKLPRQKSRRGWGVQNNNEKNKLKQQH